jgi:hypothetical protein
MYAGSSKTLGIGTNDLSNSETGLMKAADSRISVRARDCSEV